MTHTNRNTDADLARCIKSRMMHEINSLTANKDKQAIILPEIREYMIALATEIINEQL